MFTQIIQVLSISGALVSAYAYFLSRKKAEDPSYKLWCDFSETVSCSKAFMSPQSHLFGVSNALLGIPYFALVAYLFARWPYAALGLAIAGECVSAYLFWVLRTKLKTHCVLCYAMYAVLDIQTIVIVLSFFL